MTRVESRNGMRLWQNVYQGNFRSMYGLCNCNRTVYRTSSSGARLVVVEYISTIFYDATYFFFLTSILWYVHIQRKRDEPPVQVLQRKGNLNRLIQVASLASRHEQKTVHAAFFLWGAACDAVDMGGRLRLTSLGMTGLSCRYEEDFWLCGVGSGDDGGIRSVVEPLRGYSGL